MRKTPRAVISAEDHLSTAIKRQGELQHRLAELASSSAFERFVSVSRASAAAALQVQEARMQLQAARAAQALPLISAASIAAPGRIDIKQVEAAIAAAEAEGLPVTTAREAVLHAKALPGLARMSEAAKMSPRDVNIARLEAAILAVDRGCAGGDYVTAQQRLREAKAVQALVRLDAAVIGVSPGPRLRQVAGKVGTAAYKAIALAVHQPNATPDY
mmetsp:Transcript_52628/g.87404  ORF Transcript_52628/g.87404 Transcript_52628/m.87404 type:complete len:216 (-) Transcript_52628:151-798(-)